MPHEEIRHCERVIRIFSNRESAIRLLGALLMEQVAQWSAKMRHFVMAAYWQSRSTRSPLGSERPQGQGNVIPDRDLAEENRSHAEDVQRERPTDRRHGCRGDRHGELTGYTVNFVTVRQDSEFLIMSPADEMAKT